MSITAIYELPVPIWISTEVLGERIRTGVGLVTFDVLMPTNAGPVGGPPTVQGLQVPTHDGPSELLVWTQRFAAFPSDPDSTALCRVVVQTLGPGHPTNASYDLALAIDPWFEAVRTWAETVTGQDLDPNHQVYSATSHGARMTLLDPAPTTDGPIALTLTTPRVMPVPAEAWRGLLLNVAAGKEPPLEEQLSRDSRAAFARSQFRRSVVDAASASEIVLHRLISTTVTDTHMPNSEYKKRLEKLDKQPLGELVAIAEKAGIEINVDTAALKELVQVRNDAIHRGITPAYSDAYRVVQAAIDLLGRHGPWKRLGSQPDYGDAWQEVPPPAKP